MAYVKPGVEVTQVQETATPILNAPTLTATVVGEGFYWQDPNLDTSAYPTTYSGSSMTITLSDYGNGYTNIGTGDHDMVVIDVVSTAGANVGQTKHLVEGTDFTVTEGATASIAISGTLTVGGSNISAGTVKVGYRAANTNSEGYKTLDSLQAIRDTLGEPVSWNPLAKAASIAQSNSNSVITSYGTTDADGSGVLADLGTKDTYALAFIEDDVQTATIKSHVESYSSAVNKKERVAFINKRIPWTDTTDFNSATPTYKANTAGAIRDQNSAIASKRVFATHPDVGFVLEDRHVATTKPSFITASFDHMWGGTWDDYDGYCELASTIVLTDGTKYLAGTRIDDTVWAALMADSSVSMLQVYAPVPGSYYCAACAGLLISQPPEQPLTNMAMGGVDRTHGASDYWSETDLNTMAGGGTYIIDQAVPSAPISSRHQVSTNVTSIAYRELSVTKSLDFTAKFIRDGIRPYIGVNVITPAFLKLLNSVLVSQGLFLVREGTLNDFKVVSVAQDTINADTINVTVNVLVKYPVNYIKIKLVF